MRCFIFYVLVTTTFSLKLHNNNNHPCDEKECRAGRECVVVDGEAECLCVVSCPDHMKPVCGSDLVSYDNHCRLHQKACISETHISIKHKGYCKPSYDKFLKKSDFKKSMLSKDDLENELQNDLIDGLKEDEKKKKTHNSPAACYGAQRNALRFLIVGYFEDDLDKQSWHLEGMTYRESLWGWFFSCDVDKDKFLTPKELLSCAKKVNFFARPGQDNELTKELCIDALVDDGDKNSDRMLDFEEFTRIMDPKYQPKDKQCSLKGKTYVDGEEVFVDCNQCVCAVGHWICASNCKHTDKPRYQTPLGHKYDIDNSIDIPFESSNDVIDQAEVADLWLENIKKEKENKKEEPEEKEEFDVDDNLFADFDDKAKTDKEEEKELKMDDYYDDLYEKTKLKKDNKKNKFQLEKALKEVKDLRKKTNNLQKLLKRQNATKKPFKNDDDDFEEVVVEKHHIQPKKKDAKSKKYYDDVFKSTKWNDLIDWGDMKKLADKDLDLQNHL